MRLILVTGMSGAGKSTALKMLEDMGYFCVDNLPVPLLPKFVEMMYLPEMENVALCIDVRSGKYLKMLDETLEELKSQKFPYEILFVDASSRVLVKRFKETRRNHPLAQEGRIDRGIEKERKMMAFLKEEAHYIIDTSDLLTRELKNRLVSIFVDKKAYKNLSITVLSFGFKYGIPADADLVFDVRFMPNPYYDETLRSKTGNDKDVQDYVYRDGVAEAFVAKLCDMLDFLLPNYIKEGKNHVVVAVGCTGGRHRSVTIANALYSYYSGKTEYGLKIEHRDIAKDSRRKADK